MDSSCSLSTYLLVYQKNHYHISSFCGFRMDAIPSAHLRQQKLEHQRQLIEQKQKQKRQAVGIRQFTSISTYQSLL